MESTYILIIIGLISIIAGGVVVFVNTINNYKHQILQLTIDIKAKDDALKNCIKYLKSINSEDT